MSVTVVLVAAGHGRRFGSNRPKQFKPLLGRPLLYWPLKTFENTPSVKSVVLVLSPDYVDWAPGFLRRSKLRKVAVVAVGGRERADSVRAGVSAVPAGTSVVLVHDAARALVSRDVVERVIRAARRSGAALAAWPVPDTVKQAEGGRRKARAFVGRTIPRKGLWLAQTPQGFRAGVAKQLFGGNGRPPLTDDVQLAERAGRRVELVLGSARNFKVTLPEDFKICEALLKR
jgi:2-C-methyl-D-erythritol 4-phosphate cytidylyltransferase